MTDQTQWRERMRQRMRGEAAEQPEAVATIDAETAAVLAEAKARRKPAGARSYDNPEDWQGRASRGGQVTREMRAGIPKEEWTKRQNAGMARWYAERRAEMRAAGERKCNRCGEVKPLEQFRIRAPNTPQQTWWPYCRPCEDAKRRESNERARKKLPPMLTREEWLAAQADGRQRHRRLRPEELLAAGERRCNCCHEVKPLDQFRTRARKKDGHPTWYPYCRPCESQLAQKRWTGKRGAA